MPSSLSESDTGSSSIVRRPSRMPRSCDGGVCGGAAGPDDDTVRGSGCAGFASRAGGCAVSAGAGAGSAAGAGAGASCLGAAPGCDAGVGRSASAWAAGIDRNPVAVTTAVRRMMSLSELAQKKVRFRRTMQTPYQASVQFHAAHHGWAALRSAIGIMPSGRPVRGHPALEDVPSSTQSAAESHGAASTLADHGVPLIRCSSNWRSWFSRARLWLSTCQLAVASIWASAACACCTVIAEICSAERGGGRCSRST